VPFTQVFHRHHLHFATGSLFGLRFHLRQLRPRCDFNRRWTTRDSFRCGNFGSFRFKVVEIDASLQQQRLANLAGCQPPLPIVALVEAS